MHPETMYRVATPRIADEGARVERERRARIARGEPSPDAIAFEAPVQYLSFAARLRALLGAIRLGGGLSTGAAGA